MLRVLNIVEGTSVDGPGLRTSIYFAGCAHRCPGCHNPESWDMAGGHEMSVDEIMRIVRENDFNVTFSGGDPFYQPMDELVELASEIRRGGYTLWAFTGFLFEDIFADPGLSQLLPHLEVLVDGPFVNSLRDTSLLFRGSANQRLIRVASSVPGNLSIWETEFQEL